MMVSTHFHLVQKAHAQHTVFIDLAPHGLTLQLHARHAIEDALHFQREVHVSKGVDDVDEPEVTLAWEDNTDALGDARADVTCK